MDDDAQMYIAEYESALQKEYQRGYDENILTEYGLQAIDFVADFNAALAGREWNFCERCGKRTADLTVIHTCTPPQEKNT